MNLNKILIAGYLGADPDVRDINGKKVASFRVAVSEKFRGRDGVNREQVEWFTVVAWEKTASMVEKHFSKGTMVFVEGKVKTRSWQDQQGNKRSVTEVIADRLQTITKPIPNGGAPATTEQTEDDYDF